jgi:hypothetical protein
MNYLSQPPQPAEPDTTLLFLGSFFEDLHHAPVRDDAKLDALAMLILDESPKTLLGLVIRARAENWLRRHLWALAYDSLSPLEQGVRVVIDSAMRIDWRPTTQAALCGTPILYLSERNRRRTPATLPKPSASTGS